MVITACAHITLACLAVRFARMLREARAPDGKTPSVWAPFFWTVAAGCVPGIILFLVPPLVVAVTGFVFIPASFALMKSRVRERALHVDARSRHLSGFSDARNVYGARHECSRRFHAFLAPRSLRRPVQARRRLRRRPPPEVDAGLVAPPAIADASAAPVASADVTPPPAAPTPPLSELVATSLNNAAKALNDHDARAYAALFTPNAIYKEADAPDVLGRDQIASRTQLLFTSFPDFKFQLRRSVAKRQRGCRNVALEWDRSRRISREKAERKARRACRHLHRFLQRRRCAPRDSRLRRRPNRREPARPECAARKRAPRSGRLRSERDRDHVGRRR